MFLRGGGCGVALAGKDKAVECDVAGFPGGQIVCCRLCRVHGFPGEGHFAL